MVALRAVTENVVRGGDDVGNQIAFRDDARTSACACSCVCGASLGWVLERGVDVGGEDDVGEETARVLGGSFQFRTNALIRYRLGVDAGVQVVGAAEEEMGDVDVREEDRNHGRRGAAPVNAHVNAHVNAPIVPTGPSLTSQWDETVRDTLMDLKRRVRALESNFTHHDRELTDHFNSLRTLSERVDAVEHVQRGGHGE